LIYYSIKKKPILTDSIKPKSKEHYENPIKYRTLVRDGLIDEVIRPLKSGKEAEVYVVLSEGESAMQKSIKTPINAVFTDGPNCLLFITARKSGNAVRVELYSLKPS
jgi:serine/threonine-protein kinase RIO1